MENTLALNVNNNMDSNIVYNENKTKLLVDLQSYEITKRFRNCEDCGELQTHDVAYVTALIITICNACGVVYKSRYKDRCIKIGRIESNK